MLIEGLEHVCIVARSQGTEQDIPNNRQQTRRSLTSRDKVGQGDAGQSNGRLVEKHGDGIENE